MLQWQINSQNTIRFVMVDTTNVEVTGLGSGYTLDISVPGASIFSTGSGTKTEIGNGWYQYISPSSESVQPGEIALKVTGAGAAQQNLVYQIGSPNSGFGSVAHTIQIVVSGTPINGADVYITADAQGAQLVAGTLQTNLDGNVTFFLDPDDYYSWVSHPSFNFTNPTLITVV